MKCPNCEIKSEYDLVESADDYQDGYVECLNCGKKIATFNYIVIVKYGDGTKKKIIKNNIKRDEE